MAHSTCTCVIFARGGSKGLPRKNVLTLGDRPLIAWSIGIARACPSIDRVVVSTDDEEIAQVARHWGAEVPFMRPQELAADNAPEWKAWQHAIQTLSAHMPMDMFCTLPATSPFRSVEDVENTLTKLGGDSFDVVLTVRPAERSPYFNMVKFHDDGAVGLVNPPSQALHRRQDTPQVFDITTVAYAARPQFIMSHDSLFAGRVGAVVVPVERAMDIDTPYDFRLAQAIAADAPLMTMKVPA